MNCNDNKEQTQTALGLARGDGFYDLRGDEVAEDMILLTCCFNTSAPEFPAVRCLENGMVVQGVCIFVTIPRIPHEASGKKLPLICERRVGVLFRVYAHP